MIQSAQNQAFGLLGQTIFQCQIGRLVPGEGPSAKPSEYWIGIELALEPELVIASRFESFAVCSTIECCLQKLQGNNSQLAIGIGNPEKTSARENQGHVSDDPNSMSQW